MRVSYFIIVEVMSEKHCGNSNVEYAQLPKGSTYPKGFYYGVCN